MGVWDRRRPNPYVDYVSCRMYVHASDKVSFTNEAQEEINSK